MTTIAEVAVGRFTERRRALRWTPSAGGPLSWVRLRTGRELIVIDIAVAGVLVEGGSRLLPGSWLEVHLATAGGRLLVKGRVVRSHVWRVEPNRIWYRSGLAFDDQVGALGPGYLLPASVAVPPDAQGTTYPQVEPIPEPRFVSGATGE